MRSFSAVGVCRVRLLGHDPSARRRLRRPRHRRRGARSFPGHGHRLRHQPPRQRDLRRCRDSAARLCVHDIGILCPSEWQDAADILANTASYTDLTPNGAMVKSWAPIGLHGHQLRVGRRIARREPCTTGPSGRIRDRWPRRLHESDQVPDRPGQPDHAMHGRPDQPDPAPGSCGNPSVSRTGTLAARAVDNYGDPVGGGETAWSQSPNNMPRRMRLVRRISIEPATRMTASAGRSTRSPQPNRRLDLHHAGHGYAWPRSLLPPG